MKNILVSIWETFKIAIIALAIVVPIRYFIFQPFFIRGQSMEPNFQDGDYLIIDEISYRFEAPERGDVIVFKYPRNPTQRYIKRIIGLPGETVEIKDGEVVIYNQNQAKQLNENNYLPASILTPGSARVQLKPDEYFVLGDNRSVSFDSRSWGVLPKEDIVGRVFVRMFPFAALAKIEPPSY